MADLLCCLLFVRYVYVCVSVCLCVCVLQPSDCVISQVLTVDLTAYPYEPDSVADKKK